MPDKTQDRSPDRRTPDRVGISAAARLHLGFVDLNGGLGRRYGSLGMALDEPRTVVTVGRAKGDRVTGPQADRCRRHAAEVVRRLGLAPGHLITIEEAIPAHAGLGSGTQMALAVATALRRLHGLAPDIDTDVLALDRGARSGLGTGFFVNGGIALDGGRGEAERPAPIIARLPCPADWRVLLVFDPARQGMHGPGEIAAFQRLPPFPAALAAHLCRLTLMRALPAAAEGDLASFGRAVTEIQAHVGDHFSAAQGGRYSSPGVSAALEALAENGADGYGQSSWGPTGFALAASAAQADRLKECVAPLAAREGLALTVVRCRNGGAAVSERGAIGLAGGERRPMAAGGTRRG